MKLGIDCRLFSSRFTGIGRYTHELVDQIMRLNKEEGYPHEIVLFFNDPVYTHYKTTKNVTKVRVNARHYSFAEQFRFPKIIRRHRPDLMFFPHFNVPVFYRKPYIVTIHDLTLTLFPGRKMTSWYHRLAYNITIKNAVRTAKKIIAVSNHTKEDICHFLKTDPAKIEVIYNGIGPEFTLLQNTSKFAKTLRKLGINKQFLLYTGVWRSHKNLPTLLHAFHILKTRENFDFQLVLTGNPDPHYPEVRDAIKKFDLQKDVITPGLVTEKELIYLYNAAFIYVYPSLYEGFGLPPLESMKSGTPVVASSTSSIPEVVGEENALFFDPLNPEEMARKIVELHNDVNLQAELIDKGLTRASKFNWKKTAKKTYNLIKSVYQSGK